MSVEYVEGDLFAHLNNNTEPDRHYVVPHVCNDVGAYGAGFVVPLAKHFPEARLRYLAWAKDKVEDRSGEFRLGSTQFVTVRTTPLVTVCQMVAQHQTGGVRPLRYNHLAKCMEAVAQTALGLHRASIWCPLFGAGLAGGNWDFIVALIEDSWVRRGLPVRVFYLPDKVPPGWAPPA